MNRLAPRQLRVVDSHTGGEPTRVLVEGGPDLAGDLPARLRALREQHDWLRRALILEPRGSDVLVGALLTAGQSPGATAGVIFFNNVGYLGMCGHGTIGLVATLAHLGSITPGELRIDTPVGTVQAQLHASGDVSVLNVPAWRHARALRLEVPGFGSVSGDVAWGGNWFYICEDHGLALEPAQIPVLTRAATAIRDELARAGVCGAGGALIDHIELCGPGSSADSRNFVLCPGGAYDRSPCGTGTSAKLACLAADGKLQPGEVWRQESIIGSSFHASYRREGELIRPTLTGRAYITGDATLFLDPRDPFVHGIVAGAAGSA